MYASGVTFFKCLHRYRYSSEVIIPICGRCLGHLRKLDLCMTQWIILKTSFRPAFSVAPIAKHRRIGVSFYQCLYHSLTYGCCLSISLASTNHLQVKDTGHVVISRESDFGRRTLSRCVALFFPSL
jgi:hypothetical protein